MSAHRNAGSCLGLERSPQQSWDPADVTTYPEHCFLLYGTVAAMQ